MATWILFALAMQQRQGRAPKIQLSSVQTPTPYLRETVMSSAVDVHGIIAAA